MSGPAKTSEGNRLSEVLICLITFAAAFMIYTARYLPDSVAVHFGAGNQADGWMSCTGYVVFMLSFMIGMTAFIIFVVGTLPAKFPHWTNVPNRDYWLAPKRRAESLIIFPLMASVWDI